MVYIHQLRHRRLHELRDDNGHLVVREPQRPDANSKSNPKTSASSSNSITSEPVSELVSVVFVTASPTFTDDVAGYTTLTPSATASTSEQSFTYVVNQPQNIGPSSSAYVWTPASGSAAPVETAAQSPASTSFEPATAFGPSATSGVASVVDPSSAALLSSLPTSVAVAVSSTSFASSYVASRTATRSSPTTSLSSTATAAAASSSGGMSSGGKAGLAIGIILIIALVAGGALWFYWKKKKDNEWQKPDDEKAGFGGAPGAMAMKRQSEKPFGATADKQNSNAPRLSLRPVTQFIPDLASAKKRLSQGNPLNNMNKPAGMAAAGAGRHLTPGNPTGSSWERRAGGDTPANPFKDPVNPFGDQAKAVPPPPNVTVTPPMSEDGSSPDTVSAVAVGTAVGAAGAAMAAGVGKYHGQPKNRTGSPQGAPVAAAGSPPGNVYRVQLDFKPSMEDELELCAGQLVRVLHEYDDGWALCARLDRSQQGVAPRTCLSPRPVKPRPANGSPRMGPSGRPMSPAGGSGTRPKSPASSHAPSRPATANSNRPLSPPSPGQHPMMPQNSNQMAPGQFNQAPRPLSPGPVARGPNMQQPQRSQSPGPYGASTGPTPMTANQRRRSNSTSAVQAGRNSPPGSSPLGREDAMPGWKPQRPQNGPKPMPGVAF